MSAQTSGKKVVGRNVAIALGVIVIILLVGLVGAVANYTSIISGKDNTIVSKDSTINDLSSQITSKNSQIADKDNTISSLNSQIADKDSQISSLNSQVSSKDSQIQTLTSQKNQLQTWLSGNVTYYKSLIASKDSEIASLMHAIIHINLGLNYGNGTIQWFNQTEARSGDTLLDITMTVAKVNYTAYSTGAYVTSINKVEETTSKSWIWWTWTKQFGFSAGPVASDKYLLGDNETAYWYFEAVTYPPTPPQ